MSFSLTHHQRQDKKKNTTIAGSSSHPTSHHRATESDPLVATLRGTIRARRSTSQSPIQHHHNNNNMSSSSSSASVDYTDHFKTSDDGDRHHEGYESMEEAQIQPHGSSSSSRRLSTTTEQQAQQQAQPPPPSDNNNNNHVSSYHVYTTQPPTTTAASSSSTNSKVRLRAGPSSESDTTRPPLLEIPEEIYAVRKAALQVFKPLTKTWIVISVGFAMTVLFGMARWTRLLPGIPFWFILFPCWASHIGLLWLHVLSARALSKFIADANQSRQRPDSRDHLNRTEYLPLLQRSLKFGLKTGLLSFCTFLFEILVYIRLARGSISLSGALFPVWLLVTAGILDGFVCKTQHFLRVTCWILAFCAMILLVCKVDYGMDTIRWRLVFAPVICILAICSASLVYIIYGHQIGYYRLTESQLTAGNLYSLAALICIVLFVMIGEVIPLTRPVEIETRVLVVMLAPLVVCLVGMGAWVVSRDEFGRLLLYGGQSAVHPMKLRWQVTKGWTSVQGKGVTIIPMFGEVSFQPLEHRRRNGPGSADKVMELGACLSGAGCYPYEDVSDEETGLIIGAGDLEEHPYLDTTSRSDR